MSDPLTTDKGRKTKRQGAYRRSDAAAALSLNSTSGPFSISDAIAIARTMQARIETDGLAATHGAPERLDVFLLDGRSFEVVLPELPVAGQGTSEWLSAWHDLECRLVAHLELSSGSQPESSFALVLTQVEQELLEAIDIAFDFDVGGKSEG